ncbi:hypothetical protein [Levilactobacillus senmaizukei]|nr:hypothetical protein [Levilactobacillus senmaizukei]
MVKCLGQQLRLWRHHPVRIGLTVMIAALMAWRWVRLLQDPTNPVIDVYQHLFSLEDFSFIYLPVALILGLIGLQSRVVDYGVARSRSIWWCQILIQSMLGQVSLWVVWTMVSMTGFWFRGGWPLAAYVLRGAGQLGLNQALFTGIGLVAFGLWRQKTVAIMVSWFWGMLGLLFLSGQPWPWLQFNRPLEWSTMWVSSFEMIVLVTGFIGGLWGVIYWQDVK